MHQLVDEKDYSPWMGEEQPHTWERNSALKNNNVYIIDSLIHSFSFHNKMISQLFIAEEYS